MRTFVYNALQENNIRKHGKIEAENISDARKKLRDAGLTPLSIVDVDANTAKKHKIAEKIKSLKLNDKIDFTSTLEILTSTGIPIIEALLFIEQNSDSKKVSILTHELRQQIIAGSSLGETLEKYRNIFGRVYIGLVKAGEDSGELDKTLNRLIELLKKQEATKSKIISALIYPSMVVLLAVVAVLIMLIFVFPAFAEMFESLGKELPWITQTCINMGLFLKNYIVLIALATFLAFYAIIHSYQNAFVRKIIDTVALHLPMLSDLLIASNFSNFIAVLQVSYEAGIPIVDCLFLANLTMDNYILKTAIMQAASRVQQGVHLSVALKGVNRIPSMLTFMIATGEQSGRLGDSLFHCVNFIDKKLDSVIDAFTKLIEPMLMVFIGALVGFLALSLYLPLFQSYQVG